MFSDLSAKRFRQLCWKVKRQASREKQKSKAINLVNDCYLSNENCYY